MNIELIQDFIDKKSIDGLASFVAETDDSKLKAESILVADAFGAGTAFKTIADGTKDSETKLISSFNNNLVLLIQKTWVEKTDEELKAQVMYHLEEFCKMMNEKEYTKAFEKFFPIVDDVVYLMFGAQTHSVDFDEYAMRIDPEFGVFWWYIKSLPKTEKWSDSKNRLAILLGMYFLANY